MSSAIVSCSLEEAESHLRAFITSFVRPEARPRWIEFLIDRRGEWDINPCTPRSIKVRGKAEAVLRTFPTYAMNCERVPNNQCSPAYYAATVGANPGVYFAIGDTPFKLTAEQADDKFALSAASAMLSFAAGRQALFFCHDGGVWRCEKE